MNAEQRQHFSVAVETGNITHAADLLYITRQGLSKSLRNLEEDIGATLFVRSKKGISLTEEGELLWNCIQEQNKLWKNCMEQMQLHKVGKHKIIRVGMQSLYFDFNIKQNIFSFNKKHPDVDIEIIDGDFSDYWRGVTEGTLDFAFSICPPATFDCPAIELRNDTMSVLMSVENPYSSKDVIDFEVDLKGKTVLQTGDYESKLYAPVYQQQGIVTKMMAPDRNSLLAFLASGDDFYIAQTKIGSYFLVDQLCLKPLINCPINIDPYLVFRKDPNPIVRELLCDTFSFYSIEKQMEGYVATTRL